jgi:hypothetical protein
MKFMPLLFVALPVYLLAQTPPTAPPPSNSQQSAAPAALSPEEALRDRAQKLYDASVASKPRMGEPYVCESGKDQFYKKPLGPFSSAKVTEVKISADAQSAVVITAVRRAIPMVLQTQVPPIPHESNWKLESGQWCYVQPPARNQVITPYGIVDFSDGKLQVKGMPQGAALLDSLAQGIRFSKRSFSLPLEDTGKDSVTVTNGTHTGIQLSLRCPDVQGLTCRLDRAQVEMNGTATLSIAFKSGGAPLKQPAAASLTIDPFGKVLEFPISQAKQ